ncbi:MAG: repeat protein [Gemmataceae bacterium]|nr:repeat protein [Gemmataceae bacterium]
MPTARRSVFRWWWAVPLVVAIGGGAWGVLKLSRGTDSSMPPPPPAVQSAPADIAAQVHTFCGGSCHAYPPADTFPRRHWRTEVERGFRFFERSGMAMTAPPIESVIRYYEDRAPDELPPAVCPPASHPLGLRFEPVSYPNPAGAGRPAVSNVNVVRLPVPGQPAGAGRDRPAVLACDMQGGRVMLLRPADPAPAWQVLARVPHPAHAEVVDLDRDGIPDILVADLGSFPPTDRRCGSVVWLRGRPDGSFTPIKLLENVGRVADVRAADFRGTGKLDLVVGVFGLIETGEILLLENRTTDWEKPVFVPRQVDARHGAIHVPVADLDGDGKPDFVALIAQEHEMVVAYLNDGAGGFRKQTLYAAPHPGYGSSGIQLVDLNADGKLDVLYTNGDILDEPYLLKPYHGVQWLENTGGLKFEHRPIAPMYGAHNAVAADFFGTGRPAVVAVSFLPGDKFPDRETRKADAVMLLEQVAPGKFERHSLAAVECDAVVCAAGDLYGTGRPDVVVGNFSSTRTDHPVTIWKNLGRPGAVE